MVVECWAKGLRGQVHILALTWTWTSLPMSFLICGMEMIKVILAWWAVGRIGETELMGC